MDYYTLIIILTLLMLIALSVLVHENDRLTAKEKTTFFVSCAVVAVASCAEWLGNYISGNPSISPWTIKLVKLVDYSMTPFVAGTVATHLNRKSIWYKLIRIVVVTNIAIQIISVPNEWMVTIDAANIYHHGPLHSLYIALYVAVFILIFIDFANYGRDFRRQNKLSLYVIFVLAISGPATQEFSGGRFRVAYLTLAIGLTLLFIHKSEFSQIAMDDDMQKLRTKIMLSQIRPHFLFNCLAVIQETYLDDVKRGNEAISHLAHYLRNNMDALESEELIDFEDELKHVEEYLELQNLRFGEKLSVNYDLECTDFKIPLLTLQPIVENAVTYGIRKNHNGAGHIVISSTEHPMHYEISVTDDGPGFIKNDDKGDKERSHIGINNVREHLRRSCGGELSIESEPGKGSKITMKIPKTKM